MLVRLSLPVVALAALSLSGCGGGPAMAPVKGRVMFNGKPVRQASVIFAPIASGEKDLQAGKPATGLTDDDGNYTLSTYKLNDGARVGRHQVKIDLDDTNPARCKRQKLLDFEVKPGDNELNIEMEPR
jgi:hypothetical protein